MLVQNKNKKRHPMIGQLAPCLELPSTSGEIYRIPIGQKPIALFFFPKTSNLNCATEACAFRDLQLDRMFYQDRVELQIIGISSDPISKQQAFTKKHALNYPLLSDLDEIARKSYMVANHGVLGRTPGRETFFIDSKGVITGVCDSMSDPKAHIRFVDNMLSSLDRPIDTSLL